MNAKKTVLLSCVFYSFFSSYVFTSLDTSFLNPWKSSSEEVDEFEDDESVIPWTRLFKRTAGYIAVRIPFAYNNVSGWREFLTTCSDGDSYPDWNTSINRYELLCHQVMAGGFDHLIIQEFKKVFSKKRVKKKRQDDEKVFDFEELSIQKKLFVRGLVYVTVCACSCAIKYTCGDTSDVDFSNLGDFVKFFFSLKTEEGFADKEYFLVAMHIAEWGTHQSANVFVDPLVGETLFSKKVKKPLMEEA